MNIQGKGKVETVVKATYKSPYPVATQFEYLVGGRKVDLVVATEKVNLLIDGEPYNGIHAYLLFKD